MACVFLQWRNVVSASFTGIPEANCALTKPPCPWLQELAGAISGLRHGVVCGSVAGIRVNPDDEMAEPLGDNDREAAVTEAEVYRTDAGLPAQHVEVESHPDA